MATMRRPIYLVLSSTIPAMAYLGEASVSRVYIRVEANHSLTHSRFTRLEISPTNFSLLEPLGDGCSHWYNSPS